MAKAQRKPANDAETGVVSNQPQFTVLPSPGTATAASINPFGNDDPLSAIGESAAKKSGAKSYPRAVLTDPQRKQIDELNRQKIEAAALKGSMEIISGLLAPVVTDQYIKLNIGLAEVPSGILAAGVNSESLITLCGDSGGKYKEVPKTAPAWPHRIQPRWGILALQPPLRRQSQDRGGHQAAPREAHHHRQAGM